MNYAAFLRLAAIYGFAKTVASVTIAGTPGVGNVLTASLNPSLGTATSWQWNRNGSPISGQTASTYTQVTADLGATVSVLINGAYTGSIGIPGIAPAVTTAPSIASATTTAGLTWTPGVYTGTPTPTVVANAYVNGTLAQAGITQGSWTPSTAGSTVTVQEVATNSAGSVTSTSAGVTVTASSGVPTGGMKTLTVNDATQIDPVAATAGPNTGTLVGASGSGWVATVVLKGITSLVGTCIPAALTLSVSDPGYDASGNATTVTRTITGVAQIRRQYPNGAAQMISTDGTDLTIMVSLDDWIYAGTTIVSATIGSTFYTGCTAGNAGATIVNSSTVAYTKPVFGWMNAQQAYNPASTFPVEAVAFHRHARSGRQVAAMKITATDGTNSSPTITVAATSTSAIQTQGNIAEVYAATLNTSSLTAGLCNVTAKVYPWLGDSTAVLDLNTDGIAWPTPLPYTLLRFYSDPTATYGGGIAYVQIGASGGTVSSTAATARAAPFPTIQAAMNALATWNNTTSAGHSVLHLDHGGGSVRFMDASGGAVTHTLATAPTSHTALTWCEITKDALATGVVTLQWSALVPMPTLMKWTGGLVIDTGGAGTFGIMGPGSATQGTMVWLSGLACNTTTGKTISGYAQYFYLDNLTLTGVKTSFVNNGVAPVAIARAIGIVSSVTTAFPDPVANAPKLLIGCTMPGYSLQTDPSTNGDHGRIVYNNRLNSGVLQNQSSAKTINLGFANVQNLYESDNTITVASLNQWADGDLTTILNYIEQHNTAPGGRCSRMYNDIAADKVAPNGVRKIGSHLYNIWDDYNIKSDTFSSGAGSTGNWEEFFSVGNRGNISLFGAVGRGAGDAPHNDNADVPYLGSAWLPSSEYNLFRTALGFTQAQIMAMFTSYTVAPQATPAQGGTYTPLSTATNLKNRVPVGFSVLTKDLAGTARRSDGTGAAGAYESL